MKKTVWLQAKSCSNFGSVCYSLEIEHLYDCSENSGSISYSKSYEIWKQLVYLFFLFLSFFFIFSFQCFSLSSKMCATIRKVIGYLYECINPQCRPDYKKMEWKCRWWNLNNLKNNVFIFGWLEIMYYLSKKKKKKLKKRRNITVCSVI